MYFDPISAWLVALLFDGTEIIAEKTRGGTIEEYHRERIEGLNRSLNGDIRRVKAKYELALPEYALKQIQLHINVIKRNFTFQQGHGEIIIDPDNQDYIIALLEACVEEYHKYEKRALTYNQSGSADEYRAKVESYQKVIADVKALRARQTKEHEETRIRKEKEDKITGMVILTAIIIVILIVIFVIIS